MMWGKHKKDTDAPERDSEQARIEAEKNLERVKAQWPEVRDVSAKLRDLSRRNHFGDAIERIMRGGHA
jgi:hypothetical protein